MGKAYVGVWVGLYVLFSVVALGSIDASQDWDVWSDDFALYVSHARNLVEGTKYADTKFVFNPANSLYSPRAYPPGFPLLLAPVYAARGLDLQAFKAIVTLSLVLSLPLLTLLLARKHGRDIALGSAALFGLSTLVWNFQRYILPDIPFLLLTTVVLLVLDRRESADSSKEFWLSILAGLLIYATYATRVLGLTLLVGAICHDIIQRQKSVSRTAVLLAAFLCAGGVQRWILGNLDLYNTGTRSGLPSINISGGRSGAFGICFSCIPRNLYRSFAGLKFLAFLPNWIAPLFAYVVLFAIVLGIADHHFRDVWKSRTTRSVPDALLTLLRGLSAFDLYATVYMSALLVMPFFSYRYVIPVLPLAVAYALEGGSAIGGYLTADRRAGCLLMLFAGLTIYVVSHVLAGPQESDGRIDMSAAEAQNLFAFIRTKTSGDSLIAFNKPRALALFTNRRSTLRTGLNAEADLEDFRRRHIDYVLVPVGEPPPYYRPPDPIWFADSHWSESFRLEYASEHFRFLKFVPQKER
jgi:hypothetical protein